MHLVDRSPCSVLLQGDWGSLMRAFRIAISAQMTSPRIQPIIPVALKQPFDDPEWVFEFKYDGFRALYYVESGRSWFVSRNGNHLSHA